MKEDSEEAVYWFTLSDFVTLSLDYPLDKVLKDMLHLREQRMTKVTVYDEWRDPWVS
jgi:hypothetical protein